jgi:hypothetical protein
MKRLLLLVGIMLLLTGCVVYPGYDGYYDSGNYGYPYVYGGPSFSFSYSHPYGGHGYYHGGYYHGGHGGWHR